MKKVLSWILGLMVTTVFLTTAGAAEQLTINDLVGHPERWPATTKITIGFGLQGQTYNPGVEMGVYDVTAAGVDLLTSRGIIINLAHHETTLLDDANAFWASLTPAQQALTIPAIEKDRTLWPSKVTVNQTATFDKLTINAGSELPLTLVRGNEVSVSHPNTPDMLFIPAQSTDLLARARALIALNDEQRPGLLDDLLAGILVDAKGEKASSKKAKYYVIYFAASTCPRCHEFTPILLEKAKTSFADRDDVAFLVWPTEETTAPMLTYMQQEGISWPVIPAEIQEGQISSLINKRGVFETPGILVVDKFNNLLLSTSTMEGEPLDVANTALAQLESVLK